MVPIPPTNDAHASSLSTRSAPANTPFRSRRRPKPSARYLRYVCETDHDMHNCDPSSDGPTASLNRRRHSNPYSNDVQHVPNQSSDVQTTAPSSPYDADGEDEGEPDAHKGPPRRKRRKRSSPHPTAKQSRRVSDIRTRTTSSPIHVPEPVDLPSLANGPVRDSRQRLQTASKRSKSGHDTRCDHPALVFHGEPNIPGIKLWDHRNKVLVPEKVLPADLGHVLRMNKHYAIYVGQDGTYIKYPGGLLTLIKPPNHDAWMKELRKPPAERRVMIVDPKSAKLLGPRKCPALDELSSFLEKLENERSKEERRRVFNAHYTNSCGFTRQRWISMFALPPPVLEKMIRYAARDIVNTSGPPQSSRHGSLKQTKRALRQMKSVRYNEASSDSAEFQSSDLDSSVAEDSLSSQENISPRSSHSPSYLSSDSPSNSEDPNSLDSDGMGGRQLPTVYKDIFPGSSSEYEHTERPDAVCPESPSVESIEAKDFHGSDSVERDITQSRSVSPSSVLLINRTSVLKLEKLYSFHESSTSEDSLSEVLDICCGRGHQPDIACSNEDTKPSQTQLRLQHPDSLPGDAQTNANLHQTLHGNAGDSLTPHARVGESSSGGQNKSDDPLESDVPHVGTRQRGEDEVKGEHVSFVPRPRRRHRKELSSSDERFEARQAVTDGVGAADVRATRDSIDVSYSSRRNSIGNKKSIGASTNQKSGNNLAGSAKNVERVEDEVCTRLHDYGISGSAATRNKEAAHCEPSLRAKEPARVSLISRSKSTNAKDFQSTNDHVRDDTTTLHAEKQSVARTQARGGDLFSEHPVAHPSEEVYLWDYATKKRSDTLIPLSTAVKFCADNYLTMIYDGQDIKSGDQRFGKIWSEKKAWITRKGTRPPVKRRMRVWDHCTGTIEKYCFSPPMYNVEQWLKDNPNNSLFRPSLYVQQEHRLAVEETKRTELSVQPRVRRIIQTQVLKRIEQLGVTHLCEGPQRQVLLWNTVKRKCESPRDFSSRSHLTRFLFSNPALELLRGQDELFQLERSTELKLIHVTKECSAEYVCFWDTRSKETCLRPKRDTSQMKTIDECMNAEPWLQIYVGQDRPESERIAIAKRLSAMAEPRSSCSSYTLARCGKLLQAHVFSRGWVPKYIEKQKESASCAALWSKSQKGLTMESLDAALLSVEEYLQASPDLELYVGQDLPVQVQEELHRWFQLLKYEPGPDLNKAAPALLHYSLVPLKYRAIRFTSGDEFKPPRKLSKSQRRKRQATSDAERADGPSQRDKRTRVKRQRLSLRVNKCLENERNHHGSVSSFSDDEEILEDGRAAETETTKFPSQDTTNFEEENLDGSSLPGVPTISSSTLDDRCSESGSEYDTRVYNKGDASMPFPEHVPDTEDHTRSAAKLAKKMICVIREAGPKVLKRELMHDVRQDLRELLILEVESVPHLISLVKDFGSYDFASVANDLCEELQLLDVHGCFACSTGLGYTQNDLSSIREDLEAGRVCTSDEVIRKFREVCAGLIQFHDGSLLQGQAVLLRFYGEELIARFQKLHARHLGKEQQMLRMFRICERAKHIGFLTGQRNRKSKSMLNSLSHGPSEPSLRVSGRQPEVTFLNYRDEKGNSVMGKRPSLRVFGFTIDTKALECKIGNIKPCHICRKEVALSQADSMQCSNHIFGICAEIVCRECLETVFSLEQNEFKVIRDSENWFCVHCRGLCPSGSECMVATVSKGISSPQTIYHLRFVWPCAPSDSHSVSVMISKRHRNGEYDPFPESLPEDKFDLALDPSKKYWFADMDLAIGAYRCQVMVDNVWMAGSTFLVLPSASADSVSTQQPEERNAVPRSSISYLRGPHPFNADTSAKLMARTKPRGPRIRWHPIPKGSAHAVHAIRDNSAQDGGILVKTCSRTEGYDWRRAKRPATLQWVPELRSADESQGSELDKPKRVILSAIGSERAHRVATDNPPTPCLGVSHQDFLVTLNTFRYNEMLKSLWSIVTGRSNIHGIGLFTLSGYKKGDFVIEYAGDLIRTPLADIREARYDAAGLGTYLFKINDYQIVDATVQSNRARFTNHSCDPNMIAEIVHVQGRDLIVLRATRKIPKFTELTFDYKFPYEEAKVQCLCNSWNCVGVMN